MTATKARKQLDRLIDTIRRSEVDRLAQQREKLAAYIDSHAADIEENPSIAPLIHALDTYLTEKHAALLPFIQEVDSI